MLEKPLRKPASRLVVTALLLVAVALAVYAASMIRGLRSDAELQDRVESFERMKSEAGRSRVEGRAAGDTTGLPAEPSPVAAPDSSR